jgi:hypothetical protein
LSLSGNFSITSGISAYDPAAIRLTHSPVPG